MKVFTSTSFRGHYPVGTAAVIVAADEVDALTQLIDACAAADIPQNAEDVREIDVLELDMSRPSVAILRNGNY